MLIYQSPALAEQVLEALKDSVSSATTSYKIAVAYVTREGAKVLVEALATRGGPAWHTIPKAVVTCFDFGHTEPSALEFLGAQGFEVRIANLGADAVISLNANPSSFHPKIYLAFTGGMARAVLGSANLSRRALTVNTEAVTCVDLTLNNAEAVWERVISRSLPLTDEMLQQYQDLRPRHRSVPPLDEPTVPSPAEPEALPVFREIVESGEVDPSEHQAFWVDVGGPSGGSGNQLELPRLSQRFFGFQFDDYDDDHHMIGEITLTAVNGAWDCRLTWHGNNRMERINLPTTLKSGLIYARQTVLFQRSGNAFEVSVEAPTSARAERWRNESAASGTLCRFSAGSVRLCGLI